MGEEPREIAEEPQEEEPQEQEHCEEPWEKEPRGEVSRKDKEPIKAKESHRKPKSKAKKLWGTSHSLVSSSSLGSSSATCAKNYT